MKGVEIIDWLNKPFSEDLLQRTQVYYGIKEVKSGTKDLSGVPPPGRALDEGSDDCIAKALKEDLHLLTRKVAKTLNVSSTTMRNHLAKSLEMKYHYMRCVSHILTATRKANERRWPEACNKRWKVMYPPTSTSSGLVASRECFMSTYTRQRRQRRGRKWTNLRGQHIITGRRWPLCSLIVQGSTS
jgi:hypothetical protein